MVKTKAFFLMQNKWKKARAKNNWKRRSFDFKLFKILMITNLANQAHIVGGQLCPLRGPGVLKHHITYPQYCQKIEDFVASN